MARKISVLMRENAIRSLATSDSSSIHRPNLKVHKCSLTLKKVARVSLWLISNPKIRLPDQLLLQNKVSLRSENRFRRIVVNWKSILLHWRPIWYTTCTLHMFNTVLNSCPTQNYHHAKFKTSQFITSTVECSGVRRPSKSSKRSSELTHQPTQFTTLVQRKIALANTMEDTRTIVAFITAPSPSSLKCWTTITRDLLTNNWARGEITSNMSKINRIEKLMIQCITNTITKELTMAITTRKR